ncbi:hypothetical protein [Yersinia frederiksenii]|uniref:hypothetical protein n=1 Tax=Yersinia frederiksenii TaxID=29484 RepID=UPI0005E2C8E5|nr:hypothetical protein [Yersinia frederiksenii]CNL28202.1 Uncharacterised protein [Yersinia frederiksenii]
MLVKSNSLFDSPLWESIKAHIGIFFMVFGLGLVFILCAFFIEWSQITKHPDEEWHASGTLIISFLFLLSGIVLIIFSFVSTISSIFYYSDRALISQSGVNIDASIDNIEPFEKDDYCIDFNFIFKGVQYQVSDIIPIAVPLDEFKAMTTIPVRFLPGKEKKAYIRKRALTHRLRQEKSVINENINNQSSLLIDDEKKY